MKQNYMKQSVLLLIAFFILLTSCHSKKKKVDSEGKFEDSNSLLIGAYRGTLGKDTTFELFISKVTKDSIFAGVYTEGFVRSFSLPFIINDTCKISLMATQIIEPYNRMYEGTFIFFIPNNSPDNITGRWQPDSIGLISQNFSLRKRSFIYIDSAGEFPEASTRELKPADVINYPASDINLMRNEIFARHGYCFKNADDREYFENQDWYIPVSSDVRSSLTLIEKKNIPLLLKYAKYAHEHGNDFGR
jgi:hypothetical protein